MNAINAMILVDADVDDVGVVVIVEVMARRGRKGR